MIQRTYRARVKKDKLAAYEVFERDEGVPMVVSMPGCLGAGFGRVREEKDLVFLFTSLWETQKHLDEARATPTWKKVAGKLASLGFTLGEDVAEHVDLVAWVAGPSPKR
ncbi:MAG TPA: antibiotic biosynthesis monooxygenase family protein [Candidatus Thermoplasmatota archaeon]|nr:antibiotic biosynthesis monooxygenase family protein [Candidatus Thermoplasmatota archaeon]